MHVAAKLNLICNFLVLAAAYVVGIPAWADESSEKAIEELVVIADYRASPASDLPASVSVLSGENIEEAGRQHFEELINLVPNLNWAGGSSRPRYLQVRGIGERSQYQGAPNPSVGFVVDDIDFSGIGMVATLFDLERVEVLRGPQGTRYGANALGGLVLLKSRSPEDNFGGRISLSAGDDDARAAGISLGGPLGDSQRAPAARLSVHQYQSNGFRRNAFLGRDDTNGRDEFSARLNLSWLPNDNLEVRATIMHVDIDNGYDAFAIDNSFTTLSDKPGKDAQRSDAASLRLLWEGDQLDIVSISSLADSDILFSFDGDWGNDADWAPFDPYDFFSATRRKRKTISQEFRFLSAPGAEILGGRSEWLLGVYGLRLDEDNDNEDLFNGGVFSALESDYQATSLAVFGQLDTALGDATTLTTGVRVENRDASYVDSSGAAFEPSETMFGGQVSLHQVITEFVDGYVAVARGYKAGGFNIGSRIPPDRREFGAEYLWSLETGLKGWWPAKELSANLSFFFMLRDDQQVSTSFQVDPNDPLTFVFFNDNAASGRNLGIEADFDWGINASWRLFGSLGILKTRFDEYQTATRSLDGREQAHAPSYTFSLGAAYRHPNGIFARLEVTGKDRFFYSDSHDQESEPYELVNARLGWRGDTIELYAWGSNLLDERYTVRGFFFGNEPPDFAPKLYTRLGDPRTVGLGLNYRF